MAKRTREKFSARIDAQILSELRALAKSEGRQIQALIEEAFSDLLEKRRQARPRPHVMAAYEESHEKFEDLYKKLAE